MFNKILVPLDCTEPTDDIVVYSGDLAQRYGSKVTLLHVLSNAVGRDRTMKAQGFEQDKPARNDTFASSTDAVPVASPRSMKAEGFEEEKVIKENVRTTPEQARSYLESAAQKLRQKGVEVNVEMLYGEPAKEIVTYAAAGGIDMITLCPKGQDGLQGPIAGGVADRVMRESPTSVLLIKSIAKK